MTEAVCLLSGGMDSSTALAMAVQKYGVDGVTAVSFDYGQRHRGKELEAATNIRRHYQVGQHIVDLTSLRTMLGGSALTDPRIQVPDGHYAAETMKITVVPNRNAIMLSIAFGIARAASARYVYAGMHSGDHAIYPDCRSSFIRAFQGAMDEANDDMVDYTAISRQKAEDETFLLESPITLVAPFIEMTKADIVTAGHLLHVPFGLTYSCYKGQELHCGQCGTCVERKEAFDNAGVADPTHYQDDEERLRELKKQ